jgi:hypothetical protein
MIKFPSKKEFEEAVLHNVVSILSPEADDLDLQLSANGIYEFMIQNVKERPNESIPDTSNVQSNV